MPNGLIHQFPTRLGEVARLWRNELDQRLKPLGLSQARGIALLLLAQHRGGMSQTELAERVRIKGSTLVRQLDLLEADGLVERRESSTDRRVKTVHLTRRAEPMLARIEEVAHQLRCELLAGVTEPELRACLAVFDRIKQRIAGEPPAEGKQRKAG